ncbi:MAG TPA: hypothetical protein PLZ51_06535, partial [Aggregatilineales bacterium]|nr:hypothetical protein [Aggregatilineales bacterium]
STTVFFSTSGNFSSSRVGFLVHLASQTPAEGVTGFFDISVLQVTSVELSSPVIASDTPSSLTVRFNQPMPANSRVSMVALTQDGQATGLVSVLNNPTIPVSATEITLPLTFNPTQFPNTIANDTLPIRLSVSLGVNIPAAGMIPVETTIQVRPTLLIESIASSIATTVSNGGSSFSTTPIFASDATMPNLIVRFRGVSSTVGGTIRLSSSNPEFVIPAEETVQVPPNASVISIPLKLINSSFGQNQQTITFTVTDANGGNIKTVQIPFSKPNLSSISISEFSGVNGTSSLQANVNSNTNFTLTCGTPCYLNVGTNGTFTSNRPEAPGRGATTIVPLGSPFRFATFDANETLSTTITARVGDIQRSVTYITTRAVTLNGSLNTQQTPNGQPYLTGNVSLGTPNMSGVVV